MRVLILIFAIGCVEYQFKLDVPATEGTGADSASGAGNDSGETDDTSSTEPPCVPTNDGVEVCDGADNDCDGETDEGDAADASTWYADADGDGHGNAASAIVSCGPPLGYVSDADDCDDAQSAVYPGAEQVCDWITDNDCDGVVDRNEADGTYDANGDGDTEDPGEFSQHGGADGYTWCYPYHVQVDDDGDGYCQCGYDANSDGDCVDDGDTIYGQDVSCPSEYEDCDVTDPNVYSGNGC